MFWTHFWSKFTWCWKKLYLCKKCLDKCILCSLFLWVFVFADWKLLTRTRDLPKISACGGPKYQKVPNKNVPTTICFPDKQLLCYAKQEINCTRPYEICFCLHANIHVTLQGTCKWLEIKPKIASERVKPEREHTVAKVKRVTGKTRWATSRVNFRMEVVSSHFRFQFEVNISALYASWTYQWRNQSISRKPPAMTIL